MTESLAHQTIVVLGGTSGIGLAVARQSLDAGADVVVTGRDPSRLHDALEELARTRGAGTGPGGTATGELFDAGDDDALTRFFTASEQPLGHVFVSVGGPYYGRIDEMDAGTAGAAIGRSLATMVRLAQLVPPRMTAGGSIIFMSGTGSKHPAPGLTEIGATVAARAAAVANLALEIAPVRVNAIAAGFVDTPLSARLLGDDLDARRQQLREQLPIRRVVQPSDVADLALHLMENTAITGVVVDIDGGQQLLPSVGS